MTRLKDDPAQALLPGNNPASYGRLHRALVSGRFVVTAEVGPPRGASLEGFRGKARLLNGWVDAANVTDGPSAADRLASWAGCLALLHAGVEPVMQLQCRDRGALQADLLRAAAISIPNIVLRTGDPQRAGDHTDAGPVLDLDDAAEFVAMAAALRTEGRLLSGRRLSVPPRWLIGAVANPFAPPQDVWPERLGKTIAAGVQFVQTQPVVDVPAFARWLQQLRELGLTRRCYVLAGVEPIMTREALAYRRLHVPGMHRTDDVAKRLDGVTGDRVGQESLAVCADIVRQLREIEGVAGVHIVACGWEDAIPEILARAGLGRRPEDVAAGIPDIGADRGGNGRQHAYRDPRA